MKVLIVDDEKHVRDAISLLVPWDEYGVDTVLEAEDGEKASEIIDREHPALILTDMLMPIKNGVQLLEWVRNHSPSSKTLVISGHDDFDFVRHTVKYGGMDYLLKPIDPDQLNEAVRKAIDSWKEDEMNRLQSREQSIEMNKIKPVYWDKIFSNLITEPRYYYSVADAVSRELGLPKEDVQCQAVILSLDTMDSRVMDKFSSHIDLLYFTLTNICNEILRMEGIGYSFRYWNSENEVVLLCWNGLERLESVLNEINDGFHMTLNGRFDFGIGTVHPFPSGFGASYKEARQALRSRNLLQKQTRLHTFDGTRGARISSLHFTDFEENVRTAVRSTQPDRIAAAVSEWIEEVRKLPMITVEQLELWRHEYTVFRSLWLKDLASSDGAPQTSDAEPAKMIIPMDMQGKLSLDLWREELTQSLLYLSQLMAKNQQKDNNVIYEIAKYIDGHYHEEITLQDIAGRFFLSREYISRRFKQEMGENLSDYIGRIRIDKAKLLLLNPNLKISQVSEMIGYKDEKYFSKVFKKMAGISPNEYRKKEWVKN
ncbi:response regulator [Paenibacillus gansuensis]|uniref:Response regulator n=1 Tax=Paenibacillus gansuensis TaxID=306542 RepID=A0ABW5PF36_9BACL